jgi:hypothetical protein
MPGEPRVRQMSETPYFGGSTVCRRVLRNGASTHADGDIKLRKHIYRGLAEAPQAVYDVQKGYNTRKAIVVLSEKLPGLR